MKFKRFIALFLVLGIFLNPIFMAANKSVEQTPVDVVYKYIDLADPNLKREGFNQITKDEDNNELMYSLRSVFKNMPWVRKIFIIMPNENVRFLKPVKDLEGKIIYVKDKDILGFDSSSCECFIWALWKLKDYGCSNHIIFFNDDCFVGNPVNKSDFFCFDRKTKQVVPYIFFNRKLEYMNKSDMRRLYNERNKSTTDSDDKAQNGKLHHTQIACTYNFLFEAMGAKKLLMPTPKAIGHTAHNATGYRLDEIKKIYDIVNKKYKYADISLRRRVGRSKLGVLMGSFYTFYYLNKCNRQRNIKIKYRYYDLTKLKDVDKTADLFCLNTGGRKPSIQDKSHARSIMHKLFPKPTKYEKENYEKI